MLLAWVILQNYTMSTPIFELEKISDVKFNEKDLQSFRKAF